MFWDKVAPAYDLFETVYNAKVYRNTGERVAVEIDENDMVLECACGTGAITIPVAKVCRRIYATDMAVGMLRKNKRKCRKFSNIVFLKIFTDSTNSLKESCINLKSSSKPLLIILILFNKLLASSL